MSLALGVAVVKVAAVGGLENKEGEEKIEFCCCEVCEVEDGIVEREEEKDVDGLGKDGGGSKKLDELKRDAMAVVAAVVVVWLGAVSAKMLGNAVVVIHVPPEMFEVWRSPS